MGDIYEQRRNAIVASFEANETAMSCINFLLGRFDGADIMYIAIHLETEREEAEKRPKRRRKKAPQLPDNVLCLDDYR